MGWREGGRRETIEKEVEGEGGRGGVIERWEIDGGRERERTVGEGNREGER